MIEVVRYDHGMMVKGHAEYAEHGKDIVCAAFSALFQTFVESVSKLTTDELNGNIAAGNAVIEYRDLSKDSRTLIDSFFIGVEMLAETYPDNVRLTKR